MLVVLGRELAYRPSIKWARRLAYRIFGTLDVRAKIAACHLVPKIFERKDKRVILDAGCGHGLFTFLLARRLPQVSIIGVDLNPDKIADCQAVQRALQIANLEFRCADLARLHLYEFADLILCIDVLEHVVDSEAVLRSFFQAMKPSGQLIIHTPLARRHNRRLLSLWRNYFRNFTADDPIHQRYDEATLCAQIAKVGFRVTKVRFTYGPFGELAWELDALGAALGFLARAMVLPLVTVLIMLDTHFKNERFHNGMLIVAERPSK